MNVRIHWLDDKDVPNTRQRENGRWNDVWSQVKATKTNPSKWMGIECDNDEDVERARSAMLAYARRAKQPWKVQTMTMPSRPHTLYVKKISR